MRDRKKAPTLREVAAEAGVSKMAASVVLNGSRSGTRVSAETKAAIEDAAHRLGYRPNAVAQALVSRRTGIVGFYNGYFPYSPRAGFVTEVTAGLQQGCQDHCLSLLIHIHPQPQHTLDFILSGHEDGCIVIAPPGDEGLARVRKEGIPLVAVADTFPSIPVVRVADEEGGRMIARHFWERGYRRSLFVGPCEDRGSASLREKGFMSEAAHLGLEASTVREPSWHRSAAPELSSALRQPHGKGTLAVACWSDACCASLVLWMKQHGLESPADLALCGFDGVEVRQGVANEFTTIIAPWFEAARQAVGVLAALMNGQDAPHDTMLPVELLPGPTT